MPDDALHAVAPDLRVASRTLVLTDLAFYVPADGCRARIFHRVVGATGRFGPHASSAWRSATAAPRAPRWRGSW